MSVAGYITDRTVAIVLAGGKGTRLAPLTRTICKPALPFGGTLRCIDFSLSNCVNSGVRQIGVATQYAPDALLAHLAANWSSRAVGGEAVIEAWRAEERAGPAGYSGTADAVFRNLPPIRAHGASLLLVLAGDHVYKMDYRPMLEAHRARGAAVTIGCVRAPIEDAHHLGCLAAAGDGRIERFAEKPRSRAEVPTTGDGSVLASMGIYVFAAEQLADVLNRDALEAESGHDFGADVLPRLVAEGRAYAYTFDGGGASAGYWRDVGTMRAYWQAHMELLGPAPLLSLDDASWPIGRGAAAPRVVSAPVTTAAGGSVESSLVPRRCSIMGRVARSVLCDGAEIARGAKVTDSVVLPGAFVGAGSRLHGVVVDAGYRVPDGTVIERHAHGEPPVLSLYEGRAARQAGAR